jgi:protease I
MKLEGKRIAVLAEDNYQELELWYPVLRMREAGAEVSVVGMPDVETYHIAQPK